MLNIKKNSNLENLQEYLLFSSGKSCYVMARTCLEFIMEFDVPGLLLMQQALENLMKALLKANNITWPSGKKGHDFMELLKCGGNKIPLFNDQFLLREDFCELLQQLQEGYNHQRYGESGHYYSKHETMMDLFDEMVFLLIKEFGASTGRTGDSLERFVAVPVPKELCKPFSRKLKQPFIFLDLFPID